MSESERPAAAPGDGHGDDWETLAARWRRDGLWLDRSLGEVMARAAAAHPDAALYAHSATRPAEATLGTIHREGLQLAGALASLGLKRGDVIAVQLPNWVENALIYQAVAALGCVLLPIVHIFGPAELGFVLRDANARALFIPDRWNGIDFLDRLSRLGHLPALDHTIIVGTDAPPTTLSWTQLRSRGCPPPPVAVAANDLAMLIYTSGTTAAPKGVKHSAQSLVAELMAHAPEEAAPPCWLSPWPAGHIAGAIGILGHALLGRPMAIMDAWDAGAAAELIERLGVAQTSGTPFHLAGLLDAAQRDARSLTTLKTFLIGATTVPEALLARSEAAGVLCCRCYGCTEHPTATQCASSDPLATRLSTDGDANPGTQLRIVDDAGNDVSPGTDGEVAVRGPELFMGYTDARLDAEAFLPGGWFLTGDIGRLDARGFLTITDRKKDIIIRGGENISSREVEDLLLRIDGVIDAAAIALPDERLGERICACLIVRDGQVPSIEAVRAAFEAMGVARQKAPELIVALDELPRTPTGKVQKASLRTQIANMFAGPPA